MGIGSPAAANSGRVVDGGTVVAEATVVVGASVVDVGCWVDVGANVGAVGVVVGATVSGGLVVAGAAESVWGVPVRAITNPNTITYPTSAAAATAIVTTHGEKGASGPGWSPGSIPT